VTKFQPGDRVEVRQSRSHWDPIDQPFIEWLPATFISYVEDAGACRILFDGDAHGWDIRTSTSKLRLINPLDRLARET
jgi:hypothetical protein